LPPFAQVDKEAEEFMKEHDVDKDGFVDGQELIDTKHDPVKALEATQRRAKLEEAQAQEL